MAQAIVITLNVVESDIELVREILTRRIYTPVEVADEEMVGPAHIKVYTEDEFFAERNLIEGSECE